VQLIAFHPSFDALMKGYRNPNVGFRRTP